MTSVRIRQEGVNVVIISEDGRTLLDVPYTAALAIAKEMISLAKQCEAIAQRENIIRDQAILLKTGLPISLTSDKYMQQEAAKEALYDRDLRRYMGPGIATQEQFGTPEVKHGN